jgi:pterin-4a-carbinolamine dehydratase
MKLLELFEQSGKTVAVAFGRMNPPTIGHQKVVEAILKQKADAHFLFVSQTHQATGKNKTRLSNPLPFDIKLEFIQQAFPNINIGDTSVSTAIGMLQFLEKQGFENVIFVAGSDRVSDFDTLFNKQNGIDYNLKSIKVVSSGARDPDAEGAEGMSASKMRTAAIANDFESFKTGLPAGLQGNAKQVFSAVRQGLEPWIENVQEGKFRKVDIEDNLIDNDKLNDLKSKYLPDWEMLDHRILQAKYVAKDHRHAEEFVSFINKVSEKMDHFAEVTQDVAEVAVKTTTFDVKGLTILDFRLALKVDKYAEANDIEQVRMQGNFGMHESSHGRYYCSTDKKWKTRQGPKQSRKS